MGMAKVESGRSPLDQCVTSIADFLKQLYIDGGIPLVLIGLGAADMFIPYRGAQRWVVSIVLIAIGTRPRGASAYVTFLRWRTEAQVVAEHNAYYRLRTAHRSFD